MLSMRNPILLLYRVVRFQTRLMPFQNLHLSLTLQIDGSVHIACKKTGGPLVQGYLNSGSTRAWHQDSMIR